MSKKPVYITTTLPYVNNEPHVGFAMEIVRADALARYFTLVSREVFFNTGTDEHGQKLLRDAEKAGKDVKEYVDFYAEKFRGLKDLLGITEDVHFIRTTDEHHMAAAQKLWQMVSDNGYIEKRPYKAKYCVGCELEKTDSELVGGRCPIHPNKELEIIDEENYFFAFSKIAPKLKDLYEKKPKLVVPEFRFNEAKAFLERGLQDFSISRLASKMSWGVPVPGDPEHVMYVWFDALTNYISTLGWPSSAKASEGTPENLYEKFWRGGEKIQICGKDNLRQQAMMWQGILLAAGFDSEKETTDHIIVNGFINSGGQKMSKSLGNVINPYDLVEDYKGVAGDLASDVLRYYLLRHMNSFEDSDMTMESVKEAYNAHLANGLGNLVSRILTMSSANDIKVPEKFLKSLDFTINPDPTNPLVTERFELDERMDIIWSAVSQADSFINTNEPFKKIKTEPEKAKVDIQGLLSSLVQITIDLRPFMPKTADKIKELLKENKKPEKPLFQRLETKS